MIGAVIDDPPVTSVSVMSIDNGFLVGHELANFSGYAEHRTDTNEAKQFQFSDCSSAMSM